jgi:hypothetical protein
MKKLIPAIVLAITLSFGVAYGQDVTYSVGVKAWVNSWEIEFAGGGSETTDATLMIGPSASIKYDKFFGGASVLFTPGEYEWSYAGGYSEKADRTDLDLIAGYMFHPRLGVFIGYKHLKADMSYENDPVFGSGSFGTIYLFGPGFGLTGNYPVSNNIVLYGSVSYMTLDFEWEFPSSLGGGTFTSDADGASIELGAAYTISPNWNASIGIKSQIFTGDIGGDDLTNGFAGLTLGANYRF